MRTQSLIILSFWIKPISRMKSQNLKFYQIDSKRSKLKFNSTTTVSEDSGLSWFQMLRATLFVVNDMVVDFCGQKYHGLPVDEVQKIPVISDYWVEFWGKIEDSNSNVRPVGFGIIHYCGFLFCWSRQLSDKWVCGKRVSPTLNPVLFQKFWACSVCCLMELCLSRKF